MDELTALVESLRATPKRAKLVLEQVLSSLITLEKDASAFFLVDELPSIGVKVLRELGCVLDEKVQMITLPDRNLAAVSGARAAIEQMLEQLTVSAASKKVQANKQLIQTFALGSVGEKSLAAATALRRAAEAMSPGISFDIRNADGADTIRPGKPTVPLKRDDKEKNGITQQVPPVVQAVAQAVAQTMITKYQHNLGAPPRNLPSHHQNDANKNDSGENENGGGSVWCTAPDGVRPEARLALHLPKGEFTYIERPWSHFVTRWAAIDVELESAFAEDEEFSIVDLGCCTGFFCLQAATAYPRCTVLGIEGSVGVGNGTTGVQGSADDIVQTKAVQTHLHWIEKLGVQNCFVSPHVWDYERICGLAAIGRPIADVLLSLSVIHHIDNISTEQYQAAGLTHVRGTVQLVARLLELAPRHFIELPDRPWMEHVHKAFSTPRAFLHAAAQATSLRWNFVGPLAVSTWYGTRELWLLEDVGDRRGGAMAPMGLKALFPRILGAKPGAGGEGGLVGSRPPAVANASRRGAPRAQTSAPWHPLPPVAQPPGQPAWSRAGGAPVSDAAARYLPISPEDMSHALLTAPTALIAAHVQLRESMNAAALMLRDSERMTTTAGGPD